MYRPYASSIPTSSSSLDAATVIRNQTQDYCTAFNTANYDQVAVLFAPDGVFMASHHEPVQGAKVIERAFREFGESGYQDLRLETLRVEHSGDMALEIGRYAVAVRQGEGRAVADQGKFLRVWRRLGAWRIVADCWSTNLPASWEKDRESKPLNIATKPAVIGDNVPKSA
jgi:uncharacterized protein (TIGR02246 family)